MIQQRKQTGKNHSGIQPVSIDIKEKKVVHRGSSDQESEGGSREGNIGHESFPDGNRSHRSKERKAEREGRF